MKTTREVDRDGFIRRLDQRVRDLEAEVLRLRTGAPPRSTMIPPEEPRDITFSKWWWERTYQWLAGR